MVELTERPLGRTEIEYGDYSGYIRGKVTDHNLSHERTPRYELFVKIRHSDSVCDHIERSLERPVWKKDPVSLVQRLRGAESDQVRRPLTSLVKRVLQDAFDGVDEIYRSLGKTHGDESKSAAEVASRVISEWDYQEVFESDA